MNYARYSIQQWLFLFQIYYSLQQTWLVYFMKIVPPTLIPGLSLN